MMKMSHLLNWARCFVFSVVAFLGIGFAPYLHGAVADETVFAVVDGQSISQYELDAAVHMAARQRFFHRDVEPERLAELRLETAQGMIDRLLLLAEARRRAIEIPTLELDEAVELEAKRFHVDDLSDEQRLRLMVLLREQTQERLLLQRLERAVKTVGEPAEEDVLRYYEEHLDKFTTPAQLRVSVILLNVAPSSGSAVWQAAHDEAARLHERLLAGGDFAALARIHSSDSSADQGGDLGFVHQGMLSAEAQQVVDKLAPGEVSEPVVLLQGIALFKLTERRAAEVNPFERVQQRAGSLLKRERGEVAWNDLIRSLRAKANIVVRNDGALEQQITKGYVPAAE